MIEDDVQLIDRILSGDDEAFTALVHKHQKSVHALAWRKIGDFHYAEEITQDVFLQVYRQLSTLKDRQQFSGWLYVITSRCCIGWFRKNKSAIQLMETRPMEKIDRSSYSRYVSELQAAEASEYRYGAVKKILAKLPESERTVITLYYLGEMTTREISRFLGVSVNTITSRLQRARKRLQQDETLLIQEMLGSVQLSADLTESVAQKVGDIKPIPVPSGKPLLPWVAFGAAAVLMLLFLGVSNQHLVRFQKPYSFEAASEPTIEIIEAPTVLEIDVKPAVRNQVGRGAAGSKSRGAGSEDSETLSTSDAQVYAEEVEAWMPDLGLRAAVRETLGLPDDVALTQSAMKRLTELNAENRQITSLVGLEYATNLTWTLLGGNPISDVSPLANLVQLRVMNLADCQISDIQPLANLTGLESLRLHHNQIEDVTPLANLTKLTDLWLVDNYITDVRPLGNLTLLKELRVPNNAITDYSPLNALSLTTFHYDEKCESSGLPIQERIQNRSFPSIFKAWHRILNRPALSDEARLAHHDLCWSPEFALRFRRTDRGFQLAGNLVEARERRDTLIEMNPNMIFILEMRMRDADPNSPFYRSAYDNNFPWIRDSAGNMVSGSNDYRAFLIDFTHPDVREIIVQQALAVKKCGFFDGIFLSGWNEDAPVLNGYRTYQAEQQARAVILKSIRAEVGDDFLIIVGSNGRKPTQAAPYINGLFIGTSPDHINGYSPEELQRIESTLFWAEANLRSPQVNCLEGEGIGTEVPDSPTNRRLMRLLTAIGLTHSDGYVLYTKGSSTFIHEHNWNVFGITHKAEHARGIRHDHQGHYWYDFWDADLGAPVGEKRQSYRNREGVFIREFTNGWAVYNRSGQAQQVELPEVTTGVESGVKARLHTVPDLDGEIFLKER